MLIPFTQGARTLALLVLARRDGGRGLRGMAEHINTTNLCQGDKHFLFIKDPSRFLPAAGLKALSERLCLREPGCRKNLDASFELTF